VRAPRPAGTKNLQGLGYRAQERVLAQLPSVDLERLILALKEEIDSLEIRRDRLSALRGRAFVALSAWTNQPEDGSPED
jgi:hypothetical protein